MNHYRNEIAAVAVLIVLHVVGIFGLNRPDYVELFKTLTPVNLLITAGLIFAFHRRWDADFILFIAITACIGYVVEVAGVATGVIFGSYAYGSSLGVKFLDVPLMIALNWVILIYATGVISAKLSSHKLIRILFGAALMVTIDFFIEPYAIRYDLWSWDYAQVPIRNYLAWFIISLGLQLCFQILVKTKQNLVAHVAYIVMLLFFLADFAING